LTKSTTINKSITNCLHSKIDIKLTKIAHIFSFYGTEVFSYMTTMLMIVWLLQVIFFFSNTFSEEFNTARYWIMRWLIC